MAAPPPPPQPLDQRGIGKCKNFSGRREDFEKWVFPFESYCALMGWETLMIAACDETTEIDNDLLNDDAKAISRSLYHLLVSLCEGMAMNIVKLRIGATASKRYENFTRSLGRSLLKKLVRSCRQS